MVASLTHTSPLPLPRLFSYGASVLEKLADEEAAAAASAAPASGAAAVPFAAVVAREPAFEVCRMFAALLQLVNEGNVALEVSAPPGVAELRLRLLVRARQTRIEDFLAPSQAHRDAREDGGVLQPSQAATRHAANAARSEQAPAAAAAVAAVAPGPKKKSKRGATASDENQPAEGRQGPTSPGAEKPAGRRKLREVS